MDEFTARRLSNVISVLAEQRDIVESRGSCFAGHLIELAILQIRLTISNISEDELCEFSDIVSVGGGRENSQ